MATTKKAASRKVKVPWKRPAPKKKGPGKKLSSGSKSSAKARAKRAGRPYPNLIDNMAVSKNQNAKKRSPRKKKIASCQL